MEVCERMDTRSYVQARRLAGVDSSSKYSHSGAIANCSWNDVNVFLPALGHFGGGAQLSLESNHSDI